MKPYLCLLSGLTLLLSAGCVGSPTASAQTPVPVMAAPAASAASPLEELVAPIALYPDALVALILPAATASSDVVLAARYLSNSGDPGAIDQQPWDESVKGLAHYPDVVKWMDVNLAWTQRLGEAYLQQPEQVMAALQQARLVAQRKGLLLDTPQQQVVVESSTIRIIPTQPDVIYVPRYDPEIIYVERPVYGYSQPWISFGLGFGVGSWLAYDLDWRSRTIWIDRHRWDARRPDWRHPHFPGRSDYVSNDHGWHRWHPAPDRPRPPGRHFDRPGGRDFARPTPHPGAPGWRRDGTHDADRRRDDESRRDRGNWPNRSVDRARSPVQPNRVALPQGHPELAVPPAAPSNHEETSRTGDSPSVRRRRPTPEDGGQPGGFTDRRSRPGRRPDSVPPINLPIENNSPPVVTNNTSPGGRHEASAPAARRGHEQRQTGEIRRVPLPNRVAAPAVQTSPAVQSSEAVSAQDTGARVQASPREDRGDRGARTNEGRHPGRGRREQEP